MFITYGARSRNSINTKVMVWPEKTFFYNLQEGFTGNVRRLNIKYRQQRTLNRPDSLSALFRRKTTTRLREQQPASYSGRQTGAGPANRDIIVLAILLLSVVICLLLKPIMNRYQFY